MPPTTEALAAPSLLRIWADDKSIGCGQFWCLVVRVTNREAELLYIPTLTRLDVPLGEIERQRRRDPTIVAPPRRGLIGDIEDKRRKYNAWGFRYPGKFVKRALSTLREKGSSP